MPPLAEMKVHEHDPRHAHDIAFLRASVMLLKVLWENMK